MLLELTEQRHHVVRFRCVLQDDRFGDVGLEQMLRGGQARSRFDGVNQARNVNNDSGRRFFGMHSFAGVHVAFPEGPRQPQHTR